MRINCFRKPLQSKKSPWNAFLKSILAMSANPWNAKNTMKCMLKVDTNNAREALTYETRYEMRAKNRY